MQVTNPADLPMVSPFWGNYSGARSAAPNSHKSRNTAFGNFALFNLEGAQLCELYLHLEN